jgi:2-keto-3-deoxy-L-rhamnonate aldolase RhmA
MVPLVNSLEDARAAVAFARFPPHGQRSLFAPTRAQLTRQGADAGALGRYLSIAHQTTQVVPCSLRP